MLRESEVTTGGDDETVQLENVHLCLSGDDLPSADGADEMSQMVRFYGGVLHGSIRKIDQGQDLLTVWESMPIVDYRFGDQFADSGVKARNHHYRRLLVSLGDGWSKPFSVFVYEGWD